MHNMRTYFFSCFFFPFFFLFIFSPFNLMLHANSEFIFPFMVLCYVWWQRIYECFIYLFFPVLFSELLSVFSFLIIVLLQTFWIDNQRREQQQNFIPLDDNSVPRYDRGFTLGLTSANDASNVEG